MGSEPLTSEVTADSAMVPSPIIPSYVLVVLTASFHVSRSQQNVETVSSSLDSPYTREKYIQAVEHFLERAKAEPSEDSTVNNLLTIMTDMVDIMKTSCTEMQDDSASPTNSNNLDAVTMERPSEDRMNKLLLFFARERLSNLKNGERLQRIEDILDRHKVKELVVLPTQAMGEMVDIHMGSRKDGLRIMGMEGQLL